MIFAKGRWERNHRGLASLSRLPLPVKPVYKSGNPQFPAARFFGVIRHDFIQMPVPPPLARGVLSTQRLSVRRRGPCPVHAARTVRTPTRQQKVKVYALPLYAESAPCNRKPHPACMRGGQSANTLQTTGAGVTPSNNTRKPCRSWENARPQRL